MGGGGFTMEPENPALDDYVLSLADAPMPRICLLPTASGDGEAQIRQFHATFGSRACEPMHISLFRLGSRPIPLRETLLQQDMIYVGGGSMLGLLAVWRALGLDMILRECWEAGVVLAGLSAGAMCWFEWGVTSSLGSPAPSPGLGFLPGSMSVHIDGEPARLPVCRAAIADGTIPPGYAADDGVALLFRGDELERGRQLAPRPPRAAHRPGRRDRSSSRACSPSADRFGADARDRRVPPRARAERDLRGSRGRAALAPPAATLGPVDLLRAVEVHAEVRPAAGRARPAGRGSPPSRARRDQPTSAIAGSRGKVMESTSARVSVVSDHSAASTPSTSAPSITASGSQSYASRTSTAPAQVSPSSVVASYFWSR